MAPSSARKPASPRQPYPPANETTTTTLHHLGERDAGTCQVSVCVRVRPITAKEQESGASNALEVTNCNAIQLSGRRFTFDSVFDTGTSQTDLYRHMAPSLMQSFLDGYNATIIAYGQTGSGKTYTMGSEAHTELELMPSTGLIPRFLQDLFGQVAGRGDEFCLEASFLEVYGDDIHDLLDMSRAILPLREDGTGGVVCNGLTIRRVTSAAEAVQVLHEGTMNRSTAATLMNLTSSRSHAVFTVSLKRQAFSSKLTFVDLAGSERMKKTGAEGERAREGIQINMGLLALGNVINALADEERIQNGGKKIHVPYRQSKLTRLLQDALGGNSQTVFLACVSSSDTNASETLSTLHYANRARNIQNAPIRNVDFSTQQSQQYTAYISVLENELISHKFGPHTSADAPTNAESDAQLQDNEASQYLQKLRELANWSMVNDAKSAGFTNESPTAAETGFIEEYLLPQLKNSDPHVVESSDTALLSEVNPDEELAILDQLLELQQQDQDFDQEQKKDSDELKQVEGELIEKEQLLLHLRDSLKVYHNMKAKYESLIVEVQNLEREKIELSKQLEMASSDPALGCSRAIKKEIEVVERSLARARNETRKHRQMYLKAEQEAQKCRTLEFKVHELKQGRASLIKKQREAALRHREMTESKTKEIMALKRKDRNAERKMSKLESELQLHKRNLDNRQAYCRKLMEQKKQTESHLMKLLAMRQKKFRNRANLTGQSDIVPDQCNIVVQQEPAFSHRTEEVESILHLLEKTMDESVSSLELQSKYEARFEAYSELMRKMVTCVRRLEGPSQEDRVELIEAIRDLDLKIEIAAAEVEQLRNQLSQTIEDSDDVFDTATRRLIAERPAPILRTIVLGLLKKLVEGETQKRKLTNTLQSKENIVKCFDTEVDALNRNIASLKKELLRRHSSINRQGCNQQEEANVLFQDISTLSLELELAQQENMLLMLFSSDIVKDNENVVLELNETKERLAVAEMSCSLNGVVQAPQLILESIQELWKELGIPSTEREKLRSQIDHCLEGTCAKLLDEAKETKEKTLLEISSLRDEIHRMTSSLGLDPLQFTSSSKSLLKQLDDFRLHKSHLNPIMQSAVKRRQAIASKVLDLSFALGIPQESLNVNLIALLENGEDTGPVKVSESFLSYCDAAVADLQMEKSKVLTNNSALQNEALSWVKEMNLNEKEIVSLASQTVKQSSAILPSWWEKQTLEMVSRSVTTIGGVVRTSRQFTQHLEHVHDTLKNVAAVRRPLAVKLRTIIELAQQVLLKTVDREFDTNSELSIVQDEIFRLPPLSKEFICASFAEIESLSIEVGFMSQSEIEALSVVCEALNISSANRGSFWDTIDRSLRDNRGQSNGPFDDVISLPAVDGEEWLYSEVRVGSKSYVELDTRLFKLQKIHEEVEQLRDRQDSKSKIMSLDTQVRILSAQLQDFEDKKCNKQRLTTKKNTSSSLLKEERFRKQMQIKFSSKLGQLVSMLEAWKANESTLFDQDLLSEDVKAILKNSDRNAFMHLRTVEYKSSSKRPVDAQLVEPEKSLHRSKRPKLTNRTTVKQGPASAVATTMTVPVESVKRNNKKVLSPNRSVNHPKDGVKVGIRTAKHATNGESIQTVDAIKIFPTGKKKPVLDPFGNVLAQAMSPHPTNNSNSNKENA